MLGLAYFNVDVVAMMTTELAAVALKLLMWGALMAADIDLPPRQYDHPYRGPVQYVYDFPQGDDDGLYWGLTEPPQHKGGLCVIHLSPVGSVLGNQVITPAKLRVLIRHETGHCNGWVHHG